MHVRPEKDNDKNIITDYRSGVYYLGEYYTLSEISIGSYHNCMTYVVCYIFFLRPRGALKSKSAHAPLGRLMSGIIYTLWERALEARVLKLGP